MKNQRKKYALENPVLLASQRRNLDSVISISLADLAIFAGGGG